MPEPGAKLALRTAWRALRTAISPESACDAGERRAIEDEARASNVRIVRWAAFVAVLINALALVIFVRQTEGDPAAAAWAFWLIRFNVTLTALMCLATIVAWRGRPLVVWRSLGELVGALALLGGAARSANAQRAHPNLNYFIALGFTTAFFLRVRPRVFVPALLASALIVLGGITRFRDDGEARLLDELSLLGSSTLVLLGFFVARSLRIRALLAQRQVELVNAELERRVEAQQRDLAERKRAEEALRGAMVAADAANRAKSAFLANMSHEIRTPMNAVLGYTQLLQQNPGLSREHQQHLGVIRRSGDHLLELINNVLEMSKIEAGVSQLRREAVDLRGLLGELGQTFRQRARAKRLSLEIHEGPEVPSHLRGDEPRLRKVLVNLLDNAVKFTERGGVTVRATARPSAAGVALLLVEVEDTGVGIAAEQVGGLFQPFAQLRVGIEAHGGPGLGLALSREIAQLMGGDLTVESSVGVGSVFRLEIPLERADTPAPESAVHAAPAEPAPAAAPTEPAIVFGEHVASLPGALVVEISEAVRVADYDRLLGLLARFPEERAAAAEALRTLIEQYRYEDIAAAVRQVPAPAEPPPG